MVLEPNGNSDIECAEESDQIEFNNRIPDELQSHEVTTDSIMKALGP